MQELVSAIASSSTSVSSTIWAISSSRSVLSQVTDSTATATQETTASLSQISASISTTAQNVVEADRLAKGAKSSATAAGGLISDTVAYVNRIQKASKKIASSVQ